MRLVSFLLALLLPTLGAQADTPITAEAFDAYTRGKTITYGFNGTAQGGEQYLEGRRVYWSLLDGRCKEGRWYEDTETPGQICFVYEDSTTPSCWQISLTPDGIKARLAHDPDGAPLMEIEQSNEPLLCLGPEVGV